jgi:hypothetical protein
MTSESWNQVAARAAILAARLREIEAANSHHGHAGEDTRYSTSRHGGLPELLPGRGRDPHVNHGSSMWIPQNSLPAFPSGHDFGGGVGGGPSMPLAMFGHPSVRPAPEYHRHQHAPPSFSMAGGGGGLPGLNQEDILRGLHGMSPSAMLLADPRRARMGLAAETRRQNDKEKKRRKRERIGELVRAVRYGVYRRSCARAYDPTVRVIRADECAY